MITEGDVRRVIERVKEKMEQPDEMHRAIAKDVGHAITHWWPPREWNHCDFFHCLEGDHDVDVDILARFIKDAITRWALEADDE